MRNTVEPQIGTSIDLQLAGGSSGCLIPAKALKLPGLSGGPREPSVKTQSLPPSERVMDAVARREHRPFDHGKIGHCYGDAGLPEIGN